MGTAKQLNTNELITKLQELEKENARLRKILDVHGIPYVIAESTVSTKENQRAMAPKLSLQEKVALFRSVFQGREEVFAKRWYSPTTQKSGYQPVCEREWNREFCDKRKYKCADCPNRQFAPLSYGYTYNHLAGKDEYIALHVDAKMLYWMFSCSMVLPLILMTKQIMERTLMLSSMDNCVTNSKKP